MHLNLTNTERLQLSQQASNSEATRGSISLSGRATLVLDTLGAQYGVSRMQAAAQLLERVAHDQLHPASTPAGLVMLTERLDTLRVRYGYTPWQLPALLGTGSGYLPLLSPEAALTALARSAGPTETWGPGALVDWLCATYCINPLWLAGLTDTPAPAWPSATQAPDLDRTLHSLTAWSAPGNNGNPHSYHQLVAIKRDDITRSDLLAGTTHVGPAARILLAAEIGTLASVGPTSKPTVHYVPLGSYALHDTRERQELMAIYTLLATGPDGTYIKDGLINEVSISCKPTEYADLLTGQQHLDDVIPRLLSRGHHPYRHNPYWHAAQLVVRVGPDADLSSEVDKRAAEALIADFQRRNKAGMQPDPSADSL